eukprot:9490704-Pyramimonas_sp.AAC.1
MSGSSVRHLTAGRSRSADVLLCLTRPCGVAGARNCWGSRVLEPGSGGLGSIGLGPTGAEGLGSLCLGPAGAEGLGSPPAGLGTVGTPESSVWSTLSTFSV